MNSGARKKLVQDYYRLLPSKPNLELAWTMPWESLADFPISPVSDNDPERSCIVDDDVWCVPVEWCSKNRSHRHHRTIEFQRAIPPGFSPEHASGFIRRLKRIALLDRFQTVRFKVKASSPNATGTWVKNCQRLLRAARDSLANYSRCAEGSTCPDGLTLFAHLSVVEMRRISSDNIAWNNSCVARMNALFSGGLFDDWPAPDVAKLKITARENSRASEFFSDEAFTQIVRAASWLSRIQPDVQRAYFQTKDITQTEDGYVRQALVQAYRAECVSAWSSDTLRLGTEFPFAVWVNGRKRASTRFTSWPMQTVSGLKALLHHCQTANFLLVLCSGMRSSEASALPFDCLTRHEGWLYLTGNSYKDNDAPGGQGREWPLPKIAAEAIERQQDLAKAMGSKFLWVAFGGKKNSVGLPSLDQSIVAFGKKVETLEGRTLDQFDGRITAHRFRYTVARLVALSLTNASQVLFDVLGHEDVEVTLGYAHQDPEILEEINRIRREVRAVRYKEVFEEAEFLGGMAANTVRKIKAEMLPRFGDEELDTSDLSEAASILGEAELVRPGVLCTAQALERGACSSSLGLRDFSKCTTSCLHRLELSANRQDRRNKTAYIVKKLSEKELCKLERSFWEGQLISNLDPFSDIFSEFEEKSQFQEIIAGCSPSAWSNANSELKSKLSKIREDVHGRAS
ncbi:tyrosine-type recombinase/integrase [Ruegeria conchae]|uniref:tyrosine-type recombinase/integrase n=1 Tax=Ruegeria conchae TaxID=981384 RepID=UPI0021A354E1|nr:tyrosine-type recombinase/integrase [Ruegeria conchae]UWR03458.1 tyrosine-type recombinase/integrase [Ruegeria conchae]